MERYESFGDCLKRCLQEGALSASEAARLVGFRSRNSIFRILSGEASPDIKLRFLESLYEALGSQWPEERWHMLQDALAMERMGPARFLENIAFARVLFEQEQTADCTVIKLVADDANEELPMAQVLREIAASQKSEIVITGCYDAALARLLAEEFGEAGDHGRLNIRHYIDVAEDAVIQNILALLPLMFRPWYNARLVEPGSCPEEMMAIYRLSALHVNRWDDQGRQHGGMFIRFDKQHFASRMEVRGACTAIEVLDRWRFDLELLKPLRKLDGGPEVFVEYTARYGQLEENCAIYSIKPDTHFNCIPAHVLEQAILEGFEQSGMAAGPELLELIGALKAVHNARFDNMMNKRRPTHLVYSLPMMERFMRTGVLSDQFFLQRAYTVEERREIIRVLLDAMRASPWFNVHFLKPGAPELHYEISCYEGKGVMFTDAYTGYDLATDHSEALITLPAFEASFIRYFKEELLPHYVLPRAQVIQELERLLVMNVQE
jgi:hypothetical protein